MSRAELARRLDKDRSTVTKWIEGTNRPSVPDLYNISRVLGLTKPERDELFIAAGQDEYLKLRTADEPSVPQAIGPEAATSEQRLIPLQRPLTVPYFRGRDIEIEEVLQNLWLEKVVTLYGPVGIGKSAIAAEVVKQLTPDDNAPERFPDGIVAHDFFGQPQIELFFERVVELYGKKRGRVSARDAAEDILATRQTLLVLDTVEAVENLEQLLYVCRTCGILITSSQRHKSVGHTIPVGPLPPEIAREVLQAWGRDITQDQASCAQICKLVGYWPLALRIAGSYMYQRSLYPSEYLEILKETPLEALQLEERGGASIEIVLAQSIQGLSPPAQSVLGVVGLLGPYPFLLIFIAATLDISETETRLLLGELVNYSLVIRLDTLNFQISHRLIGTYASQHLRITDEVLFRLGTILYFYAEDLSTQEEPDAYHDLRQILAMSSNVINQLLRRKMWSYAEFLVWSLNYFLTLHDTPVQLSGYNIEQINRTGLELANRLHNLQLKSVWLVSQGYLFSRKGNLEGALTSYLEVLEILLSSMHRAITSRSHKFPSRLMARPSVLKLINQTLEKLPRRLLTGHLLGPLIDLLNNTLQPEDIAQIDTITNVSQQILEIAHRNGDLQTVSYCFSLLGNINYQLGYYEIAGDYCKQALDISREIGDFKNEIYDLINLALIYQSWGRNQVALDYCQQALTTVSNINPPFMEPEVTRRWQLLLNKIGGNGNIVKNAIDT